jgi:hypothetical protein
MPTPRKHKDRAHRQRAYRQRQKEARIIELQAKNMPPLASIPTMPSTARWRALVQMAADLLETAQEEMESYRDDRSEGWQDSEKADEFQERIDRIVEAKEFVEAID